MARARFAAVVVAVIVLLAGCAAPAGGPETEATAGGEAASETRSPTEPMGASVTPTAHMGCQPGEINKDGTCEVAVSGQNAAIFGATDLRPITASETTLGDTPGYLARPVEGGPYPAVIMIHEWWGLNENIKHMADILAGHGYVVFAVDLYDGEVATESSQAAELAGRVRDNPDAAVQQMASAVTALRAEPDTTRQVASLGWCFGGGQSLQLSLSDADLNATVIYYGTLTTDEETLRQIDGPVLGIFGSEDQVVAVETVREFDRTLGAIGVEREISIYEGANHAFANPSGERFHPEATMDAWETTLRFLDETLRP